MKVLRVPPPYPSPPPEREEGIRGTAVADSNHFVFALGPRSVATLEAPSPQSQP